MGQSHDFWRAYSLFVTRVASFAPERNEGANDATREYHYPSLLSIHKAILYKFISNKERWFNMKSCCRLQIRTLQFGLAFRRGEEPGF